jgi:quercetin dioxygenase-like cupin family protein
MKTTLLSALLFVGAAMAAIPTLPSAVLFDNNEVKVSRALESNHELGKFHQHKLNRVMIYLQPGRQRFEYQDGRKPQVFDWKAGEVLWSPADGMHAPQILDSPFDIIEVEVKTPGINKPVSGKLDPVKIDPRHYKVEFENPQVRVIRVRIEPHGSTPMHEHSTDRVTVFLTGQKFRVTDAAGKAETVEHKAGDVAWQTPLTHTEQNLTGEPFEALTVEVKK